MESEVLALKSEILIWQDVLNKEGVWLFLGTLGSWSVAPGWLRSTAFVITMSLFMWRSYGQRKDKTSFVKRLNELEQNIKDQGDLGVSDKANLYDIGELRKLFELKHLLRYGAVYVVCMTFWFVSIWKS